MHECMYGKLWSRYRFLRRVGSFHDILLFVLGAEQMENLRS